MNLQQLVTKAQLDLILIQCEIDKGWEKDPDWVNRGKDGKFGGGNVAKKATNIAENAKEIAESTVKTAGVTKDAIKLSIADPKFRERAGLSAGMGMAEIIKATSKAIGKTPELEEKIDAFVQDAADKLAKDYGGDKDPLAQAIRKSDGLEPPANSSVAKKMEFAAAKYQLYMEALANPEKQKYTPEQQQELVGKSIRAAIPLATDIAVNVGVGVALGLLFRQSLSHALASAVLGEAVYRGADKGLEKIKMEDPVLKAGIQLAVGIASGGVIELASKKIAGLGAKKVVAEGLKQKAGKVIQKADDLTPVPKGEKTVPKESTPDAPAPTRPAVTNLTKTDNVLYENESGTEVLRAIGFNVNDQTAEMTIKVWKRKMSDGGEYVSKKIDFEVNKSFERKDLPPEESKAIMYQLMKSFKKEIKESAEGTVFKCQAYQKDGAGDKRTAFYKLMGFGERKGGLAGIVKNGKLVPYLD